MCGKCLSLIAPDHGGVEDRARHRAARARRARAVGLASGLEQGEAALELARVDHVGHTCVGVFADAPSPCHPSRFFFIKNTRRKSGEV